MACAVAPGWQAAERCDGARSYVALAAVSCDNVTMTEPKNKPTRYEQVVRTSIVGIVANVALAAMKAAAGFAAGSIAVVLDALNSLTDAFSSIATIIGEKIACRRPSHKHPFGYGRVEYVTSILIAVFIVAAGIVSLHESYLKIVHPAEPDYTGITLAVLVVATLVKVVIGIVFVRQGRALNSQPLKASGIDALYDAILTFGTLAAAVVCLVWHVDLDGWVGLVISLFVVKAGIDIVREAVCSIIGERPDEATVKGIRTLISEHTGVSGVYDLMIDSFGPERIWVACHIEVRDDMTACEINEMTRHIEEDLRTQFNADAILGVYAYNSTGDYAAIHAKLDELVEHHPEVLQVHGFYVDEDEMHIDFDLVIDFDQDAEGLKDHIVDEMREAYPNYTYNVITDLDYS